MHTTGRLLVVVRYLAQHQKVEQDQKKTFCLLKTAEVAREYFLSYECVQLETNTETLANIRQPRTRTTQSLPEACVSNMPTDV